MPQPPEEKLSGTPRQENIGISPVPEPKQTANSQEENLLRQVADIENESSSLASEQKVRRETAPDTVAPASKSKKKLIIILALAIMAVFATLGTVFALVFNHPDTVTADAVKNLVESKTMVNDGVYSYKDAKNKIGFDIAFKSQSNIPAYAGSLEVDAKISYQSMATNVKGSGMMSESGTIYIKLQDVSQLINQALETDYGELYASSQELKDAIKKFVAKIDNKWVKLDQSDAAFFSGGSGNERACYKKALALFYDDQSQRDQVVDAYKDNRFFVIEHTGKSEAVNEQDSMSYTASYNVKNADGFDAALKQTDVGKALEKCNKDKGMSGEGYKQSSQEKQKEQQREQKEADKTKTIFWISRWSHHFTKIETSSSDKNTTTLFNATFSPNVAVELKDPQQFVKLKDFQADLENIFALAGAGSSAGTAPPLSDSPSHQAGLVASAVVSYQSNNRGTLPTSVDTAAFAKYLDATNSTNPLILPSGYKVLFVDAVSSGTKNVKDQVIIWNQASCDAANNPVASTSVRSVAITTLLESGANYCFSP